MPINLSTRELRAFVSLADERSFTRAASLNHLSQPAFSALIRGMEQSLGARLFDRTTRSVELTAEGRVFIDAARRLLQDAEAAWDDVREHAARRRGRVAIAVLPSLAAGWLPPLLAGFHQQFPGIELDVADVLSDDCIERLRAGRADFALASTRAEAPELRTEDFCRDRFHVVCRRDHPLAKRRGALALADLAPHPIVQLARSSSVRQYLEAAIYPTRLRTMLELDQLSTVAGMVRAGLGLTVVPSLTLFHFDHADLVARPLDAPGLERQVFVVRRADRGLSTAAQALYEVLLRERPRAVARRRQSSA
ncbi:LysR family transcriptional regulator [Aquincola sp. S2]|uniref:LysR family transcriptional regulator n=1 Tax=Pseudaquabacterium terrae TaxID=2732868 RepID=A0ABX2E9P1_9BURK|nr:LysR family transcriptional regulator [Aquabacterium terrae]NRF65739.1 LysR family transcriptional regulator [Aquabacterium terrae]